MSGIGKLSQAVAQRLPSAGTIYRVPVTTSSAAWVIPAEIAGVACRLRFIPDIVGASGSEEDCDIAAGTAATTLVLNQASGTPGSGVLTVSAASGMKCMQLEDVRVTMPSLGDADTHFVVIGSAVGDIEISPLEVV